MFTSRAGLFRRGPLAGWAMPLRGPRFVGARVALWRAEPRLLGHEPGFSFSISRRIEMLIQISFQAEL